MASLSYRRPRIQNLGAVFGVVVRAERKAQQLMSDITADLAAFHAPSECGDLAYRNVDRVIHEAIRSVEASTGLRWAQIVDEVRQRTGGRYMGWTFHQSMFPKHDLDGEDDQ